MKNPDSSPETASGTSSETPVLYLDQPQPSFEDTLAAVQRKKLIFTVTAGRTGTVYLSELLAAIPGIAAYHEPDPNFTLMMRRVQHNPAYAVEFLRRLKLPAIADAPGQVYAETSHVFCKGFLEPLLLMGLKPYLILLRRPPALVAHSYFERMTVPARTQLGQNWLLEPRDHGVLPLPGWEALSDYQLCFWYALAIERRQIRYATLAQLAGLTAYDVTAAELNHYPTFSAVLDAFGLAHGPETEAAHAEISGKAHNANPTKMPRLADADQQEEEVWTRISFYEPLLRAMINQRYGIG